MSRCPSPPVRHLRLHLARRLPPRLLAVHPLVNPMRPPSRWNPEVLDRSVRCPVDRLDRVCKQQPSTVCPGADSTAGSLALRSFGIEVPTHSLRCCCPSYIVLPLLGSNKLPPTRPRKRQPKRQNEFASSSVTPGMPRYSSTRLSYKRLCAVSMLVSNSILMALSLLSPRPHPRKTCRIEMRSQSKKRVSSRSTPCLPSPNPPRQNPPQ